MTGTLRLLIVDDQPTVQYILVRMAQRLGYVTHAVGSAEEALEWLETWNAHVVVSDATLDDRTAVVTDVMMPDTNGCELGKEIVRRWPEIRVLFISGYMDDELRERGICPEHIPFLPKPFTEEEFSEKIVDILASPPWDGR